MDLEVGGGGGQEVWTTPGKIKFIKFTESNSQIYRRHLRVFEFLQFTKCLLQIKNKINTSQTICHGN